MNAHKAVCHPFYSLFSEETQQNSKITTTKNKKTSGWSEKMLIPLFKVESCYRPDTYYIIIQGGYSEPISGRMGGVGGTGEAVRGGDGGAPLTGLHCQRRILRPEAQRRRLSVGAAGLVYESTDARAPPPFFRVGAGSQVAAAPQEAKFGEQRVGGGVSHNHLLPPQI